MKKIILLSILSLGMLRAYSQDAKTIFSANEVVFFGIDFSKAKFIGQFDQGFGAGAVSGSDMRSKYVPDWNMLVASDQKAFDFKKTLRKDNITYDLKSITEINKKLDADACMVFNPGKIERTEIDGMVKAIVPDVKKEGIGMVFIVENFNKSAVNADVWVVFFDIATKKVLIAEKMSGKPGGGGLKGYWGGAIKNIMKQIDENEYKNWKSKY